MNKYDVMNLDPKDMPAFLNELASEYFEDNFDIRMQLSLCATYIRVVHEYLNKDKSKDTDCWVMQPGKTASIPPYYIWKCKYCGRETYTEKPIAPDVPCPTNHLWKGKQSEEPEKVSLDCWEKEPILLTSYPPQHLWNCRYCGRAMITKVDAMPDEPCSCQRKDKPE